MTKQITALLIFMILTAQTAVIAQSKNVLIDKNGLAIQGYDPVAYFTANKAIAGKKEIFFTTGGVTYRFASTANRDMFKNDPGKFQPQYGGWCAYAMGATGEKVEIDPETFKLIDGRLYLFYNSLFNNTRKTWDKDEINLKASADKNWNKLNH